MTPVETIRVCSRCGHRAFRFAECRTCALLAVAS